MKTGIEHRIRSFAKGSVHGLERMMLDIFAILKIFLKTDFIRTDFKKIRTEKLDEIIVIGNGPSLKESVEESIDSFTGKTTACVNEFALCEYFGVIRPDYYIFLDPGYWTKDVPKWIRDLNDKDFKVLKDKVTWPMTIIMPLCAKRWNWFMDLPKLNTNIEIRHINTTMINMNCSRKLKDFLYSRNLAMPRPHTVLIGALFIAINLGYKKIFLVGADNACHENISLDERNNIYVKNEHFSPDKDLLPIPLFKDLAETEKIKMHELFKVLSFVFEGMQEIARYADYRNVKVYNASKKTWIDAFERRRMQPHKDSVF